MYIPLVVTDEQADLVSAVREMMADRADEHSLRKVINSENDFDADLWAQMIHMGLPGIAIPSELGGVGLGPVEAFLVFRETGRVLLASPLFATAGLAGNLLMHACTQRDAAPILACIADGSLRATAALCDPLGRWNASTAAIDCARIGSRYIVSGTARFVIDAASSDLILVLGRHGNSVGVFLVQRNDVSLTRLRTLDLTRPMFDVRFDRAPATLLSGLDDATSGIHVAYLHACLALIAEQVGGSDYLVVASVAYAKLRTQFGKPIGQFQAIKHKLADMVFDLERSVSAGWHAAAVASSGGADLEAAVSLAKAYCSEAYFRIAVEHIQTLGGIGFTWEHPAHLYFRRAKSSEFVLGTPGEHRERLWNVLIA